MNLYVRWLLVGLAFVAVLAYWQYLDDQAAQCEAHGGKYLYRLTTCVGAPQK